MQDDTESKRCIALTRAGTRCKNQAEAGTDYCYVHAVLAEENGEAPEASPNDSAPSEQDLRKTMMREVDDLIEHFRQVSPEYSPPPFSPQDLIDLIKRNLKDLPPSMRLDILYRLRDAVSADEFDVERWRAMWYMLHYWQHYQRALVAKGLERLRLVLPAEQLTKLRAVLNEDLLDPETWKGFWFMISYSVKYQADLVRRRFTGEYETDEWGLDWELLDTVRPLFTFLYKYYWRVEATGLEHIPDYSRALIVSNHSGQLPFDGAMIGASVMLEHPSQRLVRSLYADWFPRLPFLSSLFVKLGQTLATVDNGARLLEQEELVAVFPEGYKGVGKLYKDRYRLARFGRGGFVRMALNTQAPIIPTAVVGAEETYISLAKSDLMAKLTGFPYFPISPTWPWLGLLGLVPLPTKWYIDFGEPIPTEGYGADAGANLVLVSELTDQVRNIIQEMLYERLAQRRNIFLG